MEAVPKIPIARNGHGDRSRTRPTPRHRIPSSHQALSYHVNNKTIIIVLLSLLAFVAGLVILFGVLVLCIAIKEPDGMTHRPVHDKSSTSTDRSTATTMTTTTPEITDVPETCLPSRTMVNCEESDKFRTYDGTCNNANNPLWGASETAFKRLLDPIYEDGVSTPIGWNPYMLYNGFKKPNARKVSLEIMSCPTISQNFEYTDMVMVWGQFLDHDTDHAPKTNSLCKVKCQQESPYCFPILAPENDPRLKVGGCIPLTRSTRVCDLEPRRQLNTITSYIDASMVYGSTTDRALDLRDLSNESGHLRIGISVETGDYKLSKPLLPFATQFPQGCNIALKDTSGVPCFYAGDVRANEHLGLLALHTIFVREHNRIADELKQMNPLWTGEKLYQEARKIVSALIQIISYDHWLPKIVGTKGIDLLGDVIDYDPKIDASSASSFATAYFRFGHAQISPTVFRLGPDFQEASDYGNLDLHEAAFCPHRIVTEGGVDALLRGMIATPLKDVTPNGIMSNEVTDHLFELANNVALDLASLNIQRGRDHGLPGYNAWRKFCNMVVANTFDDLDADVKDPNLRQKLQDLYGHPDNVDLFVAGLVEDPWYDSLVGQTFTRLLVKQFKRFRDGDRFWHENPGVFTPDQLFQLKQHSLGRILCDSGDDIQDVQTDVFQYVGTNPDGYKHCDQIPAMDLTAWKDTANGQDDGGRRRIGLRIG